MARGTAPLAPSDLVETRPRKRVLVAGRVLVREGKRFDLADALGAVRVVSLETPPVGAGDLVEITGRWTGKAVVDARLAVHVACAAPRGDGEFATLSLRGIGRNLLARAKAFGVVRAYFESQGFVEVDTPLRVPAPGVDFHMDAVRAEDAYLVTSPEYHMKRLLVGGLPRIFQLSRATRKGEEGPLHEPEFSMLEWYRAFAEQDDVMRDTEELVVRVVEALAGRPRVRAPSGRVIDVRPPFRRLTVREAFRRHAGVSDAVALAEADEDRYFRLLVERVEPALAELDKPIFLCDYPLAMAALAQRKKLDPTVAERFELYLGGIELCNGYGELTCAAEQRRRLVAEQKRRKRQKRPVYPIDEKFLAALAEGMPRSAGNALGIERLLMLALGHSSIKDVLAFGAGRI